MAEVSDNAVIFITSSYQAFKVAEAITHEQGIYFAFPSCIVSLAFAGFYIEENLDVIIKALGREKDISKDCKNKYRNLGLFNKMAWFYNEYFTKKNMKNGDIHAKDGKGNFIIMKKINRKFPGFEKIYECRNKVAHGKIDYFIRISDANKLRERAKEFTTELIKKANKNGASISKNVEFKDAVSRFKKSHPLI